MRSSVAAERACLALCTHVSLWRQPNTVHWSLQPYRFKSCGDSLTRRRRIQLTHWYVASAILRDADPRGAILRGTSLTAAALAGASAPVDHR